MNRREAASIIVTEATVLGAATAVVGVIIGVGYGLGTVRFRRSTRRSSCPALTLP